MVTSEQVKGARAMLRCEQRQLADASRVSLVTIKRLEGIPGPLQAHAPAADAICRALEAASVFFIDENGDGPGVRLRKQHP